MKMPKFNKTVALKPPRKTGGRKGMVKKKVC